MVPHATGRFLGLLLLLIPPLTGISIPAEIRTIEFEPAFIAHPHAIAADPALDLGFAFSQDNQILYAFRLSTGEELDHLVSYHFRHLIYDPSAQTLMGSPSYTGSGGDNWASRPFAMMPLAANPVTGEIFDEDSAIYLPVPGADTSVWPFEQWNSVPVIDSERGLCFLTSIQSGGAEGDALRLRAIDLASRSIVDTLDLPLINVHWTFWDPTSQRVTLVESNDDDPRLLVVNADGVSPEILTGSSPVVQLPGLDTHNVYRDFRPAYLGDVGFITGTPPSSGPIRAFDVTTGGELDSFTINHDFAPQRVYANPASDTIYTHIIPFTGTVYGPYMARITVDPNGPDLFPNPGDANLIPLEIPDGWDREAQDGLFIDLDRNLIVSSCSDHIFAHSLSTLELLDTVETGRGTFDTTRWQPESRTLTRIDVRSIGYGNPPGVTALVYRLDGSSGDPLSGPSLFEKSEGVIFQTNSAVLIDATDRLAIFPQAVQRELVSLDLASEELVRHSVNTTLYHGLTRDRGLNRVATQGARLTVWHISPDSDPPLEKQIQLGHYTLDPESTALFDETRGLTMWIWPDDPVSSTVHLAVASPEFLDVVLIDLGIPQSDTSDVRMWQVCPLGQRAVVAEDSSNGEFLVVDVSDAALANPDAAEIWTVHLQDLDGSIPSAVEDWFSCDSSGRLGFTVNQIARTLVIDMASAEIVTEINSGSIEGLPLSYPRRPFTAPDGSWLCQPFTGPSTAPETHLAVIQIDPDVPGALVGDWTVIPIMGASNSPPVFTDDLLFFAGRDGYVNRIDWHTWENLGPVHIPTGSRFCDASSSGARLLATGGELSNLLHVITVPPPVEIQGLILE